MEIDKMFVLTGVLKVFQLDTKKELDALETKMQETKNDDSVTNDEYLEDGMYACYLRGILKCLEVVLNSLKNDQIDELVDKINSLDDGFAKA